MSSLTRASRPMLRILAVVHMASRGLLPQRALAPEQALERLAIFCVLGLGADPECLSLMSF